MRNADQDNLSRADSQLRTQAVWVYGAALLLCAAVSWIRGGASAAAPWPFVWMETGVAQVVCTLPLAFWLSAVVSRSLKGPAAAIVLAALAGCGWLLVTAGGGPSAPLPGGRLTLAIWRLAATLCLESAFLVALGSLLRRRSTQPDVMPAVTRSRMLPLWSVGVAIVAPVLFVEARIHREADTLVELVEVSRLGRAAVLAHTLSVIDPQRPIDGYPVAAIADELERHVAELDARASIPLAPDAGAAAQLERAQEFATLGRDAEALQLLDSLEDGPVAAEAFNLAGFLHEDLQQWTAGLDAYERSRELARRRPGSPDRTRLLADDARGVAYCQRKLGHNSAAETAYLELLALAPRADTHYLLAQFYEDTQQTDRARHHADRAAALAPAEFGAGVRNLKKRLSTTHFGCWGVTLRETAVRSDDVPD